jgi:hypothetical protein
MTHFQWIYVCLNRQKGNKQVCITDIFPLELVKGSGNSEIVSTTHILLCLVEYAFKNQALRDILPDGGWRMENENSYVD